MNSMTNEPVEASSEPSQALGPIDDRSRIDVMDILRGFALVGIIFMNVEWFGRSLAEVGFFDTALTGIDHAAGWFVRSFIEGKFYKLFTVLFGMGFTIMLLRAQEAGRPFGACFTRRMIVLLVFGLAHAIFIWSGDILHAYAIGGLVFLLWVYAFRTRRLRRFNTPQVFLKIGLVWLVLPVFLASIAGLVYSASTDFAQLEKAWNTDVEIAAIVATRLAEPATDVVDSEERDPEDEIDDDTELTDEERKEQRIEAAVEIKRDRAKRVAEEESVLSQGSYIDSIRYRISQLPKLLGQSSLFVILMFLPMCLVGYWFIATGILKNHRQHRALFRNMALIGTSSGFMLSVGGLMIMQHPAGDADISVTLVAVGGMMFHLSQYLMSAGYFGIIVLLAGSRFARKALRQLALFGRMALTNYIMQSVVMAAIFYSIGAGLYGEVSRVMQILLVIPIVLLQILYSRWWMSRFRFGPLEWVWRSATYKSLQKMKI